MPFTPYHFGPSGFVGLVFRRWLDIPVFMLANVVIDLEPGVVLLFGLNYPVHGLCHTFLVGTAIAFIWALIAYPTGGLFKKLMALIALPYQTSMGKIIISAVLGVWFHIFIDSLCWRDICPFWPLRANPFISLMTINTVHSICIICFAPAIVLYIVFVVSQRAKKQA